MGRAPGHLDPEGQRARVGDHQPAAGGLGDHGRVGAVAAGQGRERAEAAVLLADHAVHGERPLEPYAGGEERRDDCQVGRDTGLHVAGPAAVEPAPVTSAENGSLPPQVSGSPGGTTSRWPCSTSAGVPSPAVTPRPARTPVPLDLGPRKPGIGAEFVEVDLPVVHGQAGVAEHAGGDLDHLDLGRCPHTGTRTSGASGLHKGGLVEVLEDTSPAWGQAGGSSWSLACHVSGRATGSPMVPRRTVQSPPSEFREV